MLTTTAHFTTALPLKTEAISQAIGARGVSGDDTAALTLRLSQGNEDAFHEFHAQYFDRLFQFLLVVTRGQEHEAQEALQETLVRVARYVRPFAAEDVFWCWLKRVARSAARDLGRKQQRYWRLLENFALGWKIGGDEAPSGPDENLADLLEESLAEIEPDERRLVEGKYVQGATVRELADETGLTEKAIESRLRRVRFFLRAQLLKKLNPS